jgi:hypothetical protein
MKFTLGQVVVTSTANQILGQCGARAEDLLARHQAGDWGDVSPKERQINDEGLTRNLSIISSYKIADGHLLTVFTKADRSCTFVHLAPKSDSALSNAGDSQVRR